MKTMTIYTLCNIKPAHSGFGLYDRGEVQSSPENSYAFLGDLEARAEITPLESALADDDFKEAGVENINGRIHNQPGRLYAKIQEDAYGKSVAYYGVVESEVSENYFE